jgi:O-antigen ligase
MVTREELADTNLDHTLGDSTFAAPRFADPSFADADLGPIRTGQRKAAARRDTARTIGSFCEKGIAWVLMAAVAGTAVASGAVEPWSLAIFELMAISIIILWAVRAISERRVLVEVPASVLPMGLLVLMGVAQSLALTGEGGRTQSLSLDVEATRLAVLTVFFLLICFLAAANFLAVRKRMQAVVRGVTIYGLVMAVFALAQHLSQEGRTYWLRPMSQGNSWFGPFVNHAHYAGYIALLIPLPIALAMNGVVRKEERLLFGFAAAVMGLSVIISLSRGGMIAMAAELMLLLIGSSSWMRRLLGTRDDGGRHKRVKGRQFKRIAALGGISMAIAVGVVLLGPEPVANRIARGNGNRSNGGESLYESRGWIWHDSIRVWEAHPLAGVGMGAFETAFPMYSESDGSLLVSQSHNDYLQILTDCGVVGGVLAIWFIGANFAAVRKGLGSQDPFRRSLALGSGAAILGMLVHSLFDFNLQVPSTALLFLLMCAIAYSAGKVANTGGRKANVAGGA